MWRAHFAATLRDLDFQSSLVDPDVWMHPATRKDGFKYYEYFLVYVDDLLVISHQATAIIQSLETHYHYRLKDVGTPTRYLGGIIGRYDCAGTNTWFISAEDYINKALPIIETRHGILKQNKADTPLPGSYHPELDTSPFLRDDEIELYQSYIGILCWAVELGRIDLTHSVSLMARFAACPRDNQFQQVIGIFAYLKKHLRSKIVMDIKTHNWDQINWIEHDWKEYYPEAIEPLPNNAPEPRGIPVQINMFCDAAHATDLITC